MNSSAEFLLTISGILLLGLLTSTLARRTFLPRVTMLLIFGVIIGKDVLDVVPSLFADRFELIADLTLLMVGFLLGSKLNRESMRGSKAAVFWIASSAALMTTLVVTLGLVWLGIEIPIAIVLGCIASATAPAAVLDVVTESGKKNRFADLLLAIVAFDDALALIIFAIGISLVTILSGNGGDEFFLLVAGRDIGGAIMLGALLGLPAAYLTGRIKEGQPILSEALGLVMLCGGLAIWLGVSHLIAAMVMGAVIANLATHHEYAFHEIENLESPLMVVFFVLAGASLDITALTELGLLGTVYILCRIAGKTLDGVGPVTSGWCGYWYGTGGVQPVS